MTRALPRPRSRCDEDHRLCVMAITSTFDGVATNGITQGRQGLTRLLSKPYRLFRNVPAYRDLHERAQAFGFIFNY